MDKNFLNIRKNIKRVLFLIMCFVMIMGTVSVCASSKKTVRTQKKLISEMKKSNETTLVLKTDKALKISIPNKKKSANKTLIIEAPNASIINKANFKTITIKEAKSYTEKASGNVIVLKSDSIPVTVYKGSKVKKLTAPTKNANIKLQKKATIEVMEYSASDEDISYPVIATVKGGTKLDLTGGVVDVIKKVNEDNGVVYGNGVYFTIDENGNIHSSSRTDSINEKYMIQLDIFRGRNYFSSDESSHGSLHYCFPIYDGEIVLDGLSLFEGWNGKASILNFIDDEYRFGLRGLSFVVFKNGVIIDLTKIINSYKNEAEKVIEQYKSLVDYYMETRNWTAQQALLYMNGIVAKFDGWFIDFDNMTDDEYQFTLTRFCVEMAMCDWADNKDDTIKNYGCILLTKPEIFGLDLYIHCTYDEYIKLYPKLKKK